MAAPLNIERIETFLLGVPSPLATSALVLIPTTPLLLWTMHLDTPLLSDVGEVSGHGTL